MNPSETILIACECSGRITQAFLNQGIPAMSCDLNASPGSRTHFQGDLLKILPRPWKAIIAFPPCTYLSNAGNSSWNKPGQSLLRADALQFVARIWEHPAQFICVENPTGILSRFLRKPDQIIHPYYFGERELKRTCLWLKGFPLLTHCDAPNLFYDQTHTKYPEPVRVQPSGKPVYFMGANATKSTRAKIRSTTFHSIAQAMAIQWAPVLKDNQNHIV